MVVVIKLPEALDDGKIYILRGKLFDRIDQKGEGILDRRKMLIEQLGIGAEIQEKKAEGNQVLDRGLELFFGKCLVLSEN